MAGIILDPTSGPPKTHLDVKCTGFNPAYKIVLETVDPDGVVSGYNANGESTNQNRPMRDGSLSAGILSPPKEGISKVQAKQNGLLVATASFTGQTPPPITVSTASDSAEFVRQINVIRVANNLNPVVQNQIAFQAAVDSVTNSANTGDTVHHDWISPLLGNLTTKGKGEILYQSTNLTPVIATMITAWMNSPEHKAIILNPLYDSAGGAFSRVDNKVYAAMEWIDFPSVPVPTTDTWSSRPAFGSRTTSATVRIVGQSGFTISGKKFAQQIGHDIVSIRLEQCSNFKILDNDFDSDTEPIFCYQCHDFELGWLRAKNIVGPSQRDGTHRGNLVQMDTCTKFLIHDCKIKGGDTEDVISMFKSGGRSATDMSIVDKIQMEMTGWKSGSGTGIILGDAGGGYIEVMNSMLLNPGQVGIQIIDGPGLKVHDNIIYSAKGQIAPPNVGISSYGGNPIADVYNNKVKWFKNDGSENPYWFGAGSITNRTSNQWHAAIDPSTLTVIL
jgi:uncharacterized protein YkwD